LLVQRVIGLHDVDPAVRADSLARVMVCGDGSRHTAGGVASLARAVHRLPPGSPSEQDAMLEVCFRLAEEWLRDCRGAGAGAGGGGQSTGTAINQDFTFDCYEIMSYAASRVLCARTSGSLGACGIAQGALSDCLTADKAADLPRHLGLCDALAYLERVLRQWHGVSARGVVYCAAVADACVLDSVSDDGNASVEEEAAVAQGVQSYVEWALVRLLHVCPRPNAALACAVVCGHLRVALAQGAGETVRVLQALQSLLAEHPDTFLGLFLVAAAAHVSSTAVTTTTSTTPGHSATKALVAALQFLEGVEPSGELVMRLVQLSTRFDASTCPADDVAALVCQWGGPATCGRLLMLSLASPSVGDATASWLVQTLFHEEPARAVGGLLVALALWRHDYDTCKSSVVGHPAATTPKYSEMCVRVAIGLRGALDAMCRCMREQSWRHARVAEVLDLCRAVLPGGQGAGYSSSCPFVHATAAAAATSLSEFSEHDVNFFGSVPAEASDLVAQVVRELYSGELTHFGLSRMALAGLAGRLAARLLLGRQPEQQTTLSQLCACLQREDLSDLLAHHQDDSDYGTTLHESLHMLVIESAFLPCVGEAAIPLSHTGRSAVRLELILSPHSASTGGLLLHNTPARTIAAVHFVSGVFLHQDRDPGSWALPEDMQRIVATHRNTLVPSLLASLHAWHLLRAGGGGGSAVDETTRFRHEAYSSACAALAECLSDKERVPYVTAFLQESGCARRLFRAAVGGSMAAQHAAVRGALALCERVVPLSSSSLAEEHVLCALPLWGLLSWLRILHHMPDELLARLNGILADTVGTLRRFQSVVRGGCKERFSFQWLCDIPIKDVTPASAAVAAATATASTLTTCSFEVYTHDGTSGKFLSATVTCASVGMSVEICAMRDVQGPLVLLQHGEHGGHGRHGGSVSPDSAADFFCRSALGYHPSTPSATCVVLPQFQELWGDLSAALVAAPPECDTVHLAALMFQVTKYFYTSTGVVLTGDWMLYSLCCLGQRERQAPLAAAVLDAVLAQCAYDDSLGCARRAILRAAKFSQPDESADALGVLVRLAPYFLASSGGGPELLTELHDVITGGQSMLQPDGSRGSVNDLSKAHRVSLLCCCAAVLDSMEVVSQADTTTVRACVDALIPPPMRRAVAFELAPAAQRHKWRSSTITSVLALLDTAVSLRETSPMAPRSQVWARWDAQFVALAPPDWLRDRPWVGTSPFVPTSPRRHPPFGRTPVSPSKRHMDAEFVNELEREAHATRPVLRPIPRILRGGNGSGRSTSEAAAAHRGAVLSSTEDSTPAEDGSQSPAWASTRGNEREEGAKDLPWEEKSTSYADAGDGDEEGQEPWNGGDEEGEGTGKEGGRRSSSSFSGPGASFSQTKTASSSSAAAASTASSEVDTWANTATCASDIASKFGVSF